MSDKQEQINQLLYKLEELLKRQEKFSNEVNELKQELIRLKTSEIKSPTVEPPIKPIEEPVVEFAKKEEQIIDTTSEPKPTASKKLLRDNKNKILGGVCSGLAKYYSINLILIRFIWIVLTVVFCIGILLYILLWIIIPIAKTTETPLKRVQHTTKTPPKPAAPSIKKTPENKSDLENFIGVNLISKIGIIITIIGVGIGAKYSIEHDLISPLTRIILGYLIGLGLLGFGLKLKQKYENFSAVLVSGAMAILYFMTYAAYSFYGLIPQGFAFALMLVFTAFTVMAAIKYDRQIIAHIGLVGAYAVPFLLSENSDNVTVLFSYMAIINIGILIIAFKKYWKLLYYSSFLLTWLIYFSWFASEYQPVTDFALALTFLTVFFAIFYVTFLGYKLLRKEKFEISDIFLLLLNSFVFYGIGYSIFESQEIAKDFVGLFTVCNALIHLIVSVVIYRQKLADKNLFYLVSGLVLVFLTIAIPVQLDGNWVTLLWVSEATLLFWIGRTKNISIYEKLSYPLMILSVCSLFQDWEITNNYFYTSEANITPIFNISFLTSLIFIGAFSFINVLNYNKKYKSNWVNKKEIFQLVSFSVTTILLITIYLAFRIEIVNYCNQFYANNDLANFKTIWVLNYSLLFFIALSIVNYKKLKNRLLGLINLGINTLAIVVFLIQGLYVLSELRDSYLSQSLLEYNNTSVFYIGIRYISFAFVTVILIVSYNYIRKAFMKVDFKMVFELLLHITILWILTSELINWMDLLGSNQSYKLGLSILWGLYALLLIVLGIWKKKTYLRIAAISLFSITLLKLFLYDVAHLNTIEKTIVFVSLGILLLIISFLYNKYKHKISGEN